MASTKMELPKRNDSSRQFHFTKNIKTQVLTSCVETHIQQLIIHLQHNHRIRIIAAKASIYNG
jgi:hypothetical protein